MRAALVAVLVVTAGLAGCLTASDDGGGMEDGPAPAPSNASLDEPRRIDVTLEPCDAVEGLARVDAAVARDHVPDDFDLLLGDNDQALVILGGLRCGDDAEGTERGFVAIFVEPRDDTLTGEGIENYFWEPEHILVPGNEVTEAFHTLGADATDGTGVNITFGATETLLTIDRGNGTHRLASDVPVVPGGSQEAHIGRPFREYSMADGGYVYLEADFQAGGPQARGNTIPMDTGTAPGTVARDLFGAEATLTSLNIEGFTYADATVGFVPRGDGG